jgi:hypothetical protein
VIVATPGRCSLPPDLGIIHSRTGMAGMRHISFRPLWTGLP